MILEACCLTDPLYHNLCLAEFCINQVIKHHDLQILLCCLLGFYTVLNAERFLLHISVIPPIAQFQTPTTAVQNLPIPVATLPYTHAHLRLSRFSVRPVNIICGWCNIPVATLPYTHAHLRLSRFKVRPVNIICGWCKLIQNL